MLNAGRDLRNGRRQPVASRDRENQVLNAGRDLRNGRGTYNE